MTGHLINSLNKLLRLLSMLPESAIQLISRFAVASVFWNSAQTKITGGELFGQSWKFWNVTDNTLFLFQYEYTVPALSHQVAAYLATFGEFFLSLAIVFGIATRLGALGLLAMTAVIQIFVYPQAWGVHILWASILLYLIKRGGGKISLDYFLAKRFMP
jgi:putative oxidoreductase